MSQARSHGGNSMCAPLRRVLVCGPATAGWRDPAAAGRWRELGYRHAPDAGRAQEQHDALVAALRSAGCETLELAGAPGLSLDAVYVHDPSLMTDAGAIPLHMGKEARRGEAARHAAFYAGQGIPLLGEVRAPGTAEGGDLVWLDERTLLAGRGYRTNAAGVEQLRRLLQPLGAAVIEAPLPHGQGPGECLHLMSLMSVLDDEAVLVDHAWLSVPTVELLRERGRKLLPIADEERDTLACNVLALGEGRLLAFEENRRTNDRLREAGFQVLTVPGEEIGRNGGGGPTCLTRPLLRG